MPGTPKKLDLSLTNTKVKIHRIRKKLIAAHDDQEVL